MLVGSGRTIIVLNLSCFPHAERYIPYNMTVFAATGAGNGTEISRTDFTEEGSK